MRSHVHCERMRTNANAHIIERCDLTFLRASYVFLSFYAYLRPNPAMLTLPPIAFTQAGEYASLYIHIKCLFLAASVHVASAPA
jgi:hypothetical protein